MTSVSPSTVSGSVGSSQVRNVCSGSSRRARSRSRDQISRAESEAAGLVAEWLIVEGLMTYKTTAGVEKYRAAGAVGRGAAKLHEAVWKKQFAGLSKAGQVRRSVVRGAWRTPGKCITHLGPRPTNLS
jgi:hypothetical protein